jgi:hypothetical protein
MPRCAQLLIGALVLLAHQTVGLAAVLEATAAVTAWAVSTPAVLITVAGLATHHLLNHHGPRHAPAHT